MALTHKLGDVDDAVIDANAVRTRGNGIGKFFVQNISSGKEPPYLIIDFKKCQESRRRRDSFYMFRLMLMDAEALSPMSL